MRKLIGYFILVFSFSAWGDMPVYLQGLRAKTENKQKSRFTVSDWIAQKQNNASWDQWLAMNKAPEIFEFFIRGGTQNYDVADEPKTTSWAGGGLFVTILGLEYEVDRKHDETEIQSSTFHFRIFGEAYQSTHLTLQGGLQNSTRASNNTQFQNPYYGAELGLYIFPALGLRGRFRQMSEDTNELSQKLSGIQYLYGPFLEVGFFRITFEWFQDEMKLVDGTTETNENRNGFRLGASLFF